MNTVRFSKQAGRAFLLYIFVHIVNRYVLLDACGLK